jgi:hypothetical protein
LHLGRDTNHKIQEADTCARAARGQHTSPARVTRCDGHLGEGYAAPCLEHNIQTCRQPQLHSFPQNPSIESQRQEESLTGRPFMYPSIKPVCCRCSKNQESQDLPTLDSVSWYCLHCETPVTTQTPLSLQPAHQHHCSHLQNPSHTKHYCHPYTLALLTTMPHKHSKHTICPTW